MLIIIGYLLSYRFQYLYGLKRYKKIINPISLFLLIFFLHNISFFFSVHITDKKLTWMAFTEDYSTINEVAIINLTCLWAFFVGLVLVKMTKIELKKYKQYDFNIYMWLYVLFTVITFSYTYKSAGIYGESQALTSGEAYNPIAILFSNSRIIWACVILSLKKTKKRTKNIILLIEIFGAILLRGRKALFIILTAYFISKYEHVLKKIRFKHIVYLSFLLVIISYMSVFVIYYRLIPGDLSFADKIVSTNNTVLLHIDTLFFSAINSANSEGVQNWTYQLLQNNELTPLYGLSYLQALVNTIVLRPYQGDLVNYQAAFVFRETAYPNMPNMGFDYSFTAEALLNFYFFAFIPYFILGLAIGYVWKRRNYSEYYNTLYIIIYSIMFITFRTDSTSFFRYISFYIISFFFFRLLRIIKKSN